MKWHSLLTPYVFYALTRIIVCHHRGHNKGKRTSGAPGQSKALSSLIGLLIVTWYILQQLWLVFFFSFFLKTVKNQYSFTHKHPHCVQTHTGTQCSKSTEVPWQSTMITCLCEYVRVCTCVATEVRHVLCFEYTSANRNYKRIRAPSSSVCVSHYKEACPFSDIAQRK